MTLSIPSLPETINRVSAFIIGVCDFGPVLHKVAHFMLKSAQVLHKSEHHTPICAHYTLKVEHLMLKSALVLLKSEHHTPIGAH